MKSVECGIYLAPHDGRAQVGGICKQLQRLDITECLNRTVRRHLLILTVDEPQGPWLAEETPKQGLPMSGLWKGFSSYAVIGIANTVIHWQLFFVCRTAFEFSQALSNFVAFCMAASFSFYMNTLYTFSLPASWLRYLAFMVCMGGLSLLVGALADRWHLPGLVTVAVFSALSLVCGFLLSRHVVFRERRR